MTPRSPKDTICINKWNWPIFKMHTKEFKTCCLTKFSPMDASDPDFMNSQYQIDRRVDMMKGIRHPECNSCWKQEDLGAISMRTSMMNEILFSRQFKHKLLDEFGTDDLDEIADKVTPESSIVKFNNPKKVEFILGNQCDLHCVYCSRDSSSQWTLTDFRNKVITREQYKLATTTTQTDDINDAVWKWVDSDVKHTVQYISILGGEPLIMPEFYNTVTRLLEIFKNTENKPRLTILTNLNTPEKYFNKFLDYLPELSQCFDVIVSVSIESIYSKAEYIRSNLTWSIFEGNLDTLLAIGDNLCKVQLLPSINALSLSGTAELLEWYFNKCYKFNRTIKLETNIIARPEFLSPYILPSSFSEFIDLAVTYLQNQATDTINYKYYCDYLLGIKPALLADKPVDQQIADKFIERIDMFDTRSNLKFADVFPEMQNFYTTCKRQHDKR